MTNGWLSHWVAATNPVKLSTSVGKRVILFFNVLRCPTPRWQWGWWWQWWWWRWQWWYDSDNWLQNDFNETQVYLSEGDTDQEEVTFKVFVIITLQYDCHGSFLLFSDFRHIHTQHPDCSQEGVKMSQSDSILTDMTHVLSPCLDLRSPLHSISEDDYDCGPMPDMTHMTISWAYAFAYGLWSIFCTVQCH